MKKKPLVSSPHHLQEEVGGVTTPPSEYWVTAVAAYTSSDLIATGEYYSSQPLSETVTSSTDVYRGPCVLPLKNPIAKAGSCPHVLGMQLLQSLTCHVPSPGSSDGYVRLWKCGEFFRSVEPLFSVPLVSRYLQLPVRQTDRCLTGCTVHCTHTARVRQLPSLLPPRRRAGGGGGAGAPAGEVVSEGEGGQEQRSHHPSYQDHGIVNHRENVRFFCNWCMSRLVWCLL